MKTVEKIVIIFAVIVFVTFMINHGFIDFSGIDWVKNKAQNLINSEKGQEYIEETKEISSNVFHDLFYGIKDFFMGKDEDDENSESLLETSINSNKDLQKATLLSVVDGDTIKVAIGSDNVTIRLIGIDCPESKNPDVTKNNQYGEAASKYTKQLLDNYENLYLEYDISSEDSYGRTLAYVWLYPETDNINNMLNAILLKEGYAYDKIYLPNKEYSEIFDELCENAKEEKAGLWNSINLENL